MLALDSGGGWRNGSAMQKQTPLPDIARLHAAEGWLFDLDNTLYPAHCDLFAQIDQRMGTFISGFLGVDSARAREVQKAYWASHGTTLNGLMSEHGMAPEPFLEFVHDIDLGVLKPDPVLDNAIARLTGVKIIFTNGTVRHAENVLRQLNLRHHFEAIIDIAATGYVPKPLEGAYTHAVAAAGLNPQHMVMIDDSVKNLQPAHALGMTTIWAMGKSEWSGPEPQQEDTPFIHHATGDLAAFLTGLSPAAGT